MKKDEFQRLMQLNRHEPIEQSNKQSSDISFSDYCRNNSVIPLTHDTILPTKPPIKATKHFVPKIQALEDLLFVNETESNPSFFRHGQKHLPKELRSGKYPIHYTLDLHNQTKAQALESLKRVLSQHPQTINLRIIHGRGNHSKDHQSILLHVIRNYLASDQRVLAYSMARDNDGGVGVTLVRFAAHK